MLVAVGAGTDVVVLRAGCSLAAGRVGRVVEVASTEVVVDTSGATVVGGVVATVVEGGGSVVVDTSTRTAGTSSVAGAGSGRTSR